MKCSNQDCEAQAIQRGMCSKHFNQYRWQINKGREEAKKLYPTLGTCERCGVKPACDRHHKDGDTFNNTRSNIEFLCRGCHMKEDGRLAALAARGPSEGAKRSTPLTPCVTCGLPYKPLAKGECPACYMFRRRRGCERKPKHFLTKQWQTSLPSEVN